MKIQLNLKTYSPSRACEVTHTSMVWAREGAGGGYHQTPPNGKRDQGVGRLAPRARKIP